MLKKDDPDSQVCYYQVSTCPSTVSYAPSPTERLTQAGIGTYIKPGAVSPFLHSVVKFLDSGLALYISHHVLDGYMFLMQHYRRGDNICIFGCVFFFGNVIPYNLTFFSEGYSRGAYIARALAGMLHKVSPSLQSINVSSSDLP